MPVTGRGTVDGNIVIVKRSAQILVMLFQHNKLQSLHVTEPGDLLGNIYIGRVQKVLPELKAAFVDVEKGLTCFLQKGDLSDIKGNDEIPVQITAEAVKTKPPVVSRKLTLTGRYCVVSCQEPGLSFSGKLSTVQKKHLKKELAVLSDIFTKYHVIIRTNAGELDEIGPLLDEIRQLAEELAKLQMNAPHRTCYSLLYEEHQGYIKAVRDIRDNEYDKIVTDLPDVYDGLHRLYGNKVRYYQDDLLSLGKLYSVETHLQNSLNTKIWLDMGGFLVIEPTEALTVIDVNSGKSNPKKLSSFLELNKQAAQEAARQVRIRNLSGIIIVDFVNMESSLDEQELLSYMRELVKRDSVKTNVIDITPLGLMEITRKKIGKTLSEVLDTVPIRCYSL